MKWNYILWKIKKNTTKYGDNKITEGTRMIQTIVKRDGRCVLFDLDKIAAAIFKAAQALGGSDYEMARALAEQVAASLEEAGNQSPTVEEIQDAVERTLVDNGHARTAKEFILYRAQRTRVRDMNTRLMKTYEELTYKSADENDIKRENANIDGDTAMGTMLKYGSEGAKQFYHMFVLRPEHSKAHLAGDIHIHDLDFLTLTTTCCQIDIDKLFTGGFCTGHGFLREPNDISSYAALACIAIQSNQNDQHGGQSIPNFDYGMAKGVAKTYRKLYTRNLAKGLELFCGIDDAEGDVDWFFEELDRKIDLVIDQLMERFEIQAKKKVRNYPFLMGQGVWIDSDKLGPDDEVREVLKHGTLSMGFIGLAETLKALIGQHHGESEYAQNLGLEIIGHMRRRMDDATRATGFNYTLLATPAEGLSGRFVRMDRKQFGELEGITDHEFYTNSFHIPVYYNISASEKIRLEAPYHALTNAGHISYIELDGDPLKNLDAFEQVVRYMKECGIGYGSINHPVDRDPVCGYTGIIDEVCPRCGRREGEAVSVQKLRELGCWQESAANCGYCGDPFEESERSANPLSF